ncbi:unnamed protein product [Linum tenue]|uniref:Uncharacterized protein n=1 Tax=Linum tenue TaxID=586396 RepID=A0AAV0QSQ4_9ROSI|nr:unnamed protein product [Linum tenue]
MCSRHLRWELLVCSVGFGRLGGLCCSHWRQMEKLV